MNIAIKIKELRESVGMTRKELSLIHISEPTRH